MLAPQFSVHTLWIDTPCILSPQIVRWRAVTTRDAAANWHFVCRSTGIYCRPTCGARLVRRANVEFHATPTEATAADSGHANTASPT
ncbi:hypothetical protein V1527DRAFT_297405 [Lipomyces starkeyi]